LNRERKSFLTKIGGGSKRKSIKYKMKSRERRREPRGRRRTREIINPKV
jgi:hypothetical protein